MNPCENVPLPPKLRFKIAEQAAKKSLPQLPKRRLEDDDIDTRDMMSAAKRQRPCN